MRISPARSSCWLLAGAPLPRRCRMHRDSSISPVFHQLVAFSLPPDFKSRNAAYEQANGFFYIREHVPQGESVDHWTQMITLTGTKDLARTPMPRREAFVATLAAGFRRHCPDTLRHRRARSRERSMPSRASRSSPAVATCRAGAQALQRDGDHPRGQGKRPTTTAAVGAARSGLAPAADAGCRLLEEAIRPAAADQTLSDRPRRGATLPELRRQKRRLVRPAGTPRHRYRTPPARRLMLYSRKALRLHSMCIQPPAFP